MAGRLVLCWLNRDNVGCLAWITDFFAQPKELKSIQEFLSVTRRSDARGT